MPTKDELLTDDSRDTLEYIRDVRRYRKDPVGFVTDILGKSYDPYYHFQKEVLYEFYRDLYGNGEPYKNLYMCLGQRSSKTMIGYFNALFGFFTAITEPNPSERWGIDKDSLIRISIASNTEKQLDDGMWWTISKFFEDENNWFSQWFDITVRKSDIFCKKYNVKIRPLSCNAFSAAGAASMMTCADEVDLFESEIGRKSSMELINILSNSTKTFGTDGKNVVFSSPKEENGTILTICRRAQSLYPDGRRIEPQTLVYVKPTWECNTAPSLTKEALMEEYKLDMDTFWRDFACQPQGVGGLMFPESVKMVDKPNFLKYINEPNWNEYINQVPHVLAVDPAAVNDKFGIGIGYFDYTTGKYIIDGIYGMRKLESEDFLSALRVRDFIGDIIEKANVTAIIYDTHMYTDVLEHCNTHYGVPYFKHVVDKVDYDAIKEKMMYGQIEMIYDEHLKYEFDNLIVKKLATKHRVDHSATSSKDMSDCVANIIWYLTNTGMTRPKIPLPIIKMF